MALRKGSAVSWAWGEYRAHGKIVERFTEKVSRAIKGTTVSRDASADEPVFLIDQDDGAQVLKSGSELTAE